jgi:hypothetical protein
MFLPESSERELCPIRRKPIMLEPGAVNSENCRAARG